MKQDRLIRLGLSESLEDFAERIGSTPTKARVSWRLEGMRFLFPRSPVRFVAEDGPRIAPGVSVPTKEVFEEGVS